MKKTIILLFFCLSLVTLFSYHDNRHELTPIKNFDITLYEPYYNEGEIAILKRIPNDETKFFPMMGYSFPGQSCILGESDRYYYVVYFRGHYYDFIDSGAYGLYNCQLLEEIGFYDES